MPSRTEAGLGLLGCLLAGLLASSCMTGRLSGGSSAYVYVAANGVITFWGEPVGLEELPRRLKQAGATRETPIKIVPQGDVSERLLRSIAGNIGRKGLPRVLILEPRKAVLIVEGQTVEEVPANEPDSSTPLPQP